LRAVAALAGATGLALAQNSNQGVSKTEITIGSIQDLSGPHCGLWQAGAPGHDAARGRDQRARRHQWPQAQAVVEDSAYDPKKAVLAAQKLVNQDKIFAMIGHIGTAQNMAAMPVQFEKNVINFFPVTAAREMYEPFHRLKYSFAATYYDQMRTVDAQAGQGKGRQEGLHHVPGRRVRPGSDARR
jgi:branched-chain amino acid transport system substrate-binding protein